ncbi:MAG: hypothetical protein DRJ07_15320 [Bacteroidetes bacterium]|nr:MAG: hypothetical protein DRJ07_15320 [Bacteroidota bacterium]
MRKKYSIVTGRINSLKFVIISLFFILNYPVNIQSQNEYPLDINYYNFIHYKENKISFPGDSSNFKRLFQKLDTIILNGKSKISIVHIGGSHIQADVYSGRMRERLQTFYPGMNGGRGSVFPYRITKTNNPRSYSVYYTGKWIPCRNVERKKKCKLGLSGLSVSTFDPSASITIKLKSDSLVEYYFNKIRIFHENDSNVFQLSFSGLEIEKVERNDSLGFSLFYLKKDYQQFKLQFLKENILQNQFVLYGISLENDDPGIVYHSVGVNGASFPSFLRCQLFEKQLAALKPDLVIISLGTNDAYTTKFVPDFYKSNYQSLINKIKRAAPESAILNTVANDSYLYRRYPNTNTQLAENVIYEVAKKNNCGVWDFFKIMGGLNSSSLWRQENLMINDMIHFNVQGYLLKGDLLFNAFIKSYDNYLSSKPIKNDY